MQNLHELPKLRDSLSYLYIEHAILDKKHQAIEFVQESGRTLIPVSNLSVLMLGPGTSITHAAITVLARSGCTVLWTGEDATRFYAQGMGETRKARRLLHQAALVSDEGKRMQVVINMYRHRFNHKLPDNLTLPQIRGMEGVRVRQAYAAASKKYGVPWHGRKYKRNSWGSADPINR
ncbi:MAG: type I-E CRISPR-associated endonuclease Cas1, partial [Chloroflexi bacterium]